MNPPPRHPRALPGRRYLRAALAGPAALVLVLSACGGGPDDRGSDRDGAADQAAPRVATDRDGIEDRASRDGEAHDAGNVIATAQVAQVEVFDERDGSRPIHTLDHPREVGAPLTFLVEREDGDRLEVLLPVRPNGSTGWIDRDDVELATTAYRIDVHLGEHRIVVHEDGEPRIEASIGVGGDGTPTPPGRYYVTELLQPPDPDGPYGAYAFGLSGFSEVHLDFAGGDGVIGIHGTNDPSSIGRDSSNGCIRVEDAVITEMAGFLPLGTPVEIHA